MRWLAWLAIGGVLVGVLGLVAWCCFVAVRLVNPAGVAWSRWWFGGW